jgi:hypothetical protein
VYERVMRCVLLLVPLALALTASPALAKGPTSFTVSGPGLDEPLLADARAEQRPAAYWRLVEGLHFFEAAMQSPSGTRRTAAPTSTLGPRYRIRHRIPLSSNRPIVIEQDLYPYASGGPVTYMRPGQEFLQYKTAGGWYRAAAHVKAALVARGLPASPTSQAAERTGRRFSAWPASGAAVLGVVALVAFAVGARRRLRPAG